MAQKQAFAYLRVSSKGQIKGDGFPRQRSAVRRYAKTHRIEIIDEYCEPVTGSDVERPQFKAMVAEMMSNGVRTILIERLDRLARDLQVQLQLLAYLSAKDIALISTDTGENVTQAMAEDPMRRAMVQMQAVFAELDRAMVVAKLRKARQRVRDRTGRCEGPKLFGVKPGEQATLDRIRELHHKPRNRPRRGYAEIARILNDEKRPTRTGVAWSRQAVTKVIKRL